MIEDNQNRNLEDASCQIPHELLGKSVSSIKNLTTQVQFESDFLNRGLTLGFDVFNVLGVARVASCIDGHNGEAVLGALLQILDFKSIRAGGNVHVVKMNLFAFAISATENRI